LTHFCGRQELYCHRQGDYNHLSLYALGESFLVDAGYGHPFGDVSKPVNRWFGLTSAHNCVLVDRLEQRGVVESPGWAEGEMLEFAQDRRLDTSLGDASSCTGPDHRVRRSLRRVVFVKGCPTPFVVVLDVNEKDGQEFLAECLWTTDSQNRVELADTGFVIHGKGNRCDARVLWPERAEIALADSMGRPQVRVAVKAPVAEVVTVFCPCRTDDPTPAFSCQREGEGRFWVTCASEGRRSRLYLTACLSQPLRKPVPIRLEAD
jgi:hypothetical protein